MLIKNKFSAYRFLVSARQELHNALKQTGKYYYVNPKSFKDARKRLKVVKSTNNYLITDYILRVASSLYANAGELYLNVMSQNTGLPSIGNKYGNNAKICLAMCKTIESERELLPKNFDKL